MGSFYRYEPQIASTMLASGKMVADAATSVGEGMVHAAEVSARMRMQSAQTIAEMMASMTTLRVNAALTREKIRSANANAAADRWARMMARRMASKRDAPAKEHHKPMGYIEQIEAKEKAERDEWYKQLEATRARRDAAAAKKEANRNTGGGNTGGGNTGGGNTGGGNTGGVVDKGPSKDNNQFNSKVAQKLVQTKVTRDDGSVGIYLDPVGSEVGSGKNFIVAFGKGAAPNPNKVFSDKQRTGLAKVNAYFNNDARYLAGVETSDGGVAQVSRVSPGRLEFPSPADLKQRDTDRKAFEQVLKKTGNLDVALSVMLPRIESESATNGLDRRRGAELEYVRGLVSAKAGERGAQHSFKTGEDQYGNTVTTTVTLKGGLNSDNVQEYIKNNMLGFDADHELKRAQVPYKDLLVATNILDTNVNILAQTMFKDKNARAVVAMLGKVGAVNQGGAIEPATNPAEYTDAPYAASPVEAPAEPVESNIVNNALGEYGIGVTDMPGMATPDNGENDDE
jgi:hypothetical protein